MFRFCSPVTKFDYQSITPLLHHLCSLCSYIFCNPIYVAYLIFFSPFIFKVLSFLSPLLICISLVIICIFTLENYLPFYNASEEEVLNALRTSIDLQDFGVEAPAFFDCFEFYTPGNQPPILHELLKESHSDEGENWVSKEIDPASLGKQISLSIPKAGQEIIKNPLPVYGAEEELKTKIEVYSEKRWGSTRREKEWKRTLACKLYEERKGGEGGEGMDLLWEIHEVDAAKTKANDKAKMKDHLSSSKRFKLKRPQDEVVPCDPSDEEEEEEEEMKGHVCCLQALRLSTGKMNLGIKSNNLVKFSRAMKGIGLVMRKVKGVS